MFKWRLSGSPNQFVCTGVWYNKYTVHVHTSASILESFLSLHSHVGLHMQRSTRTRTRRQRVKLSSISTCPSATVNRAGRACPKRSQPQPQPQPLQQLQPQPHTIHAQALAWPLRQPRPRLPLRPRPRPRHHPAAPRPHCRCIRRKKTRRTRPGSDRAPPISIPRWFPPLAAFAHAHSQILVFLQLLVLFYCLHFLYMYLYAVHVLLFYCASIHNSLLLCLSSNHTVLLTAFCPMWLPCH